MTRPLGIDSRVRDADDPTYVGTIVDLELEEMGGGFYVRWDDETLNVDGPMWVPARDVDPV